MTICRMSRPLGHGQLIERFEAAVQRQRLVKKQATDQR